MSVSVSTLMIYIMICQCLHNTYTNRILLFQCQHRHLYRQSMSYTSLYKQAYNDDMICRITNCAGFILHGQYQAPSCACAGVSGRFPLHAKNLAMEKSCTYRASPLSKVVIPIHIHPSSLVSMLSAKYQ